MNTQVLAWMKRGRSFPSTPVFVFLWLPAGFVLGTLTLLGPVRWWAKACRSFEFSARAENGGVFLMIGVLFMVSGYSARIITNVLESSQRGARIVTVAGVLAICTGAMSAWMNPALMAGSMGAEQRGGRFTFGPYPDEDRMIKLEREGYTIVSLLHPAVVPFEPKLLNDEKKRAEQIGIPFMHVPMLPWISGNVEALATIKQLASDKTRRFYIHCYLGQDRVRIVRRALEHAGVSLTADQRRHRSIREKVRFERGRVYHLPSDVYLTGYPTDDEFMWYVLAGEIGQVVALLDWHDPEQRVLIERERALLEQHNVPFILVQSDKGRYDARRVNAAALAIAQIATPVLVHAFLSPSSGQSPWADGFIQALSSRRPSLPPSLFQRPLTRGRADVVVTHVAVGPRPSLADFRELAHRGVVECIHVGTERLPVDAKRATRAGLQWRSVKRDRLVQAVQSGGPYYLYGSDAATLRADLERAYRLPVAVLNH